MADNKQDGITVFDTIFTNNQICMMKIVLPFLPPSFQKSIAVYIKYLELQYTMQYFSRHPQGLFAGHNVTDNTPVPDTLWDNLLPYCSKAEQQKIQQMRDLMQSFQQMKDMMEMMETMKELFPDGFSGSEGMGFPDGFAGMEGMEFPNGFAGMEGMEFPAGLSPELISQFGALFNRNAKKGD